MSSKNVFERDYKPFPEMAKEKAKRFSYIHYAAIAAIATVVSISLTSISFDAEANKTAHSVIEPEFETAQNRLTLPLNLPNTDSNVSESISTSTISEEIENKYTFKEVTVKKGDTLTHVFRRAGLNRSEVNHIINLGKKAKNITRVTPGQVFEIAGDEKGKLQKLVYNQNKTEKYIVQKENEQFVINHEKREYDRRITHTSGIIKSSLFETAQEAGLSDNVTMDLAHIFGWDIDFALDIRKNDQFIVLYEELFLDGERVGNGNILAAEFINQGKSYKAVRYTDESGRSNYYSQDGKSMRKAFLRTPVDFSRISSRYGNRYHPTLKKRKKHRGVDYAAPRGTPIKAAGDGKIVWRARKGGYGKTVMIQHGSKYQTLYAHMKTYNRKAKKGSYVKQGQIIGYVGTTGRSTGPHLHYEFRVNGSHRNPLTVKLPDADPIKKKYRSDFLTKSRPLLAQLDLIKDTRIAFNDIE